MTTYELLHMAGIASLTLGVVLVGAFAYVWRAHSIRAVRDDLRGRARHEGQRPSSASSPSWRSESHEEATVVVDAAKVGDQPTMVRDVAFVVTRQILLPRHGQAA